MHALYAPADDDGSDAGGGASGGGDGKGKLKDDDVVPKKQFIAAINSANAKYDALEAKFNELQVKVTATPATVERPKRYTRGELNALVEARTITQDQADAQMDFQTREDSKAEAKRVAKI